MAATQLSVSGQKPATLSPVYHLPVSGEFDPISAVKKTIVEPMFDPMNAANPVVISDASNPTQTFDEDDINRLVLSALGAAVDPDSEAELKSLFHQTLIRYDHSSPILATEVFANQAGAQHKMPPPTPVCVYTPDDDVIPAAKKFIGGGVDGSEFFAALAFYAHPNTLGFYFVNNAAFVEFQNWLTAEIAMVAQGLPGDTVNLFAQFGQMDLKGLTESLALRNDDTENNEEYSFARMLIHYMMNYTQVVNEEQYGVMPFTLGELFVPRSLVLVNVEAHARALSNRIAREWTLINRSINQSVKVVSNKKLSKLTALPRAVQKAQSAAANSASNKFHPHGRSAKVRFRKQPPARMDLTKYILRALARMTLVNRSQNVFTQTKVTFVKANRRDPDDYNKPGRLTSNKYRPDIHVFVDTSGSISERNYQGTVMMLIRLAKKMNVNLYFSSFSHVLSQETLLHTKDKSIKQIWEEFRRIPKVSGGTDYKQIWDYINMSPKRKKRFSLIITDFEWHASPERFDHPKNLYYAPCANMRWDWMVNSAKSFAKSAQHSEPAIAQRLLGVIK